MSSYPFEGTCDQCCDQTTIVCGDFDGNRFCSGKCCSDFQFPTQRAIKQSRDPSYAEWAAQQDDDDLRAQENEQTLFAQWGAE